LGSVRRILTESTEGYQNKLNSRRDEFQGQKTPFLLKAALRSYRTRPVIHLPWKVLLIF
jgi:hypothetical protein